MAILSTLAATCSLANAQSDPRFLALKKAYATDLEAKAKLPYQTALSKLSAQFQEALEREEKKAMAAADLDAVTAIRAERELLNGPGIPQKDEPSTPARIKSLRETYRAQRAKLETARSEASFPIIDRYRRQLIALERILTKESKVDEALAVREEQRTLPRSVKGLSAQGRKEQVFARASKERPYENSLGMKFVPVDIVDADGGTRKILVSVWETRVRDYAAFAEETETKDGQWRDQRENDVAQTEDHPVITVLAPQAIEFCEWLSKKEGLTYRLPTTEEWGWAAEIRKPGQSQKEYEAVRKQHAWHGSAHDQVANFGLGLKDAFAFTAPVGSYPPNGHGIFDIYGNVWEWVTMPDGSIKRRGGSWRNNKWFFKGREEPFPGIAGPANTVGFRVVIDPRS